jgi:hypothetical protein
MKETYIRERNEKMATQVTIHDAVTGGFTFDAAIIPYN